MELILCRLHSIARDLEMNTSSNNQSTPLIRITLGTILLAHGLLKILVFTIPGTVGFFESLGLPAVVAHLTIFGEVVGGTAGCLATPVVDGNTRYYLLHWRSL